jgi:PAS domain S-box-containing protein
MNDGGCAQDVRSDEDERLQGSLAVNRHGAAPSLLIGPIIPEDRRALRFGAAVLLVLGIGGVRLALIPIMGTQAPLLPFLLAVLAAASLGGRGPGLLASLLAPLLITLFFTNWPHGTHILSWSAHVTFFVMISVLVVLIMHQLQLAYRAQHRALLAAREAERAARQAERHASASAAQLHLIADSIPALIAYVDTEQHYRFSNRLYEEWFGIPPEKVIGRHVRDVLGEAAYAAVRVRMEEALSGRHVHFEAQMPFRENGMRQIEAHYIPDVGPQKAVMGYCVLVIDVTERKRAEAALKDAQRSLSLALRAGRAGSFDWDIAANLNVWSDEILALHGFNPGEFGGTHEAWLACIDPEDRERMLAAIQRAIEEGEITTEYRIRRHDTGEMRWLHGRGQVFYDEQRHPVRMIGINADITERKQTEQALREQERMLKLIYDHSSDGLYLLQVESTAHYRFISVNETFLKMTGYARTQTEGRPIEELLSAVNHTMLRSKCQEVIAARSPVVYYEEAELPAGRRYGEMTLIPIASAQGPITHILGAVKDVTERKRAEEALVEANRRKDEFLAMLAHELRNPLAPIRNVAYVLANCPVDAATLRRNSGILERQANQLTRLVDDLLDVARITRGAIELKREALAIEKVLQIALETVQPLFAVKRQTVNSTPAAQQLRVEADAVRLSQVFANLLANAAKYSPDRALIEVSVDEADGHAVVRIRDSGIGIDKQMLPHIFDLFMQADRSLDRSQGGLGVGLTIVKSLVQMHGGQVEAHSAGVGRGSEFIVRLPLLAVSDRAATFLSPDVRAKAIPRRVLVVDDRLDAADSLAALVGTAGHVVQTAHDAASALLVLHSFPAEVIFLDIGLPGTDGYVLAQSIRERFPHVSRRLYALTGYGREEDRELALSSGFDEHLTKPVDPEHLLGLVANDCPSEMPSGNPPR